MSQEQESVRAGLGRVQSDTPVRTGYLEALATWNPTDGAVGRLEAGFKPAQFLSLYGFGQIGKEGPEAGVGARLTFDL